MNKTNGCSCLFLDIGGVLLTDGWDRHARQRAIENFKLDGVEIEGRHHLPFETYETGKLTLDEYLDLVVFYQERPFTRAQFRKFMFNQSKSYPEVIELIKQLKAQHGLKIVVISNEGRELNAFRVREFKLAGWVDAFISSSFVHLRKPDPEIFRIALDIAQTPARKVVYIENTALFAHIAEGLGIRSILHTDYLSTSSALASFGLRIRKGALQGTR